MMIYCSAYNLILAWPVVAMGVFDCDVSAQFLLSNKLMYAGGRKRSDLNVVIVLEEMAQASKWSNFNSVAALFDDGDHCRFRRHHHLFYSLCGLQRKQRYLDKQWLR